MGRQSLVILGLSLLVAACAANPDRPVPAFAAAGSTAPAQRATTGAEPELEVEVQAAEEGSQVVCRNMLQQASNVIVRRCMSERDWRTYDRAQEEWARRMVRQMQGSPYR